MRKPLSHPKRLRGEIEIRQACEVEELRVSGTERIERKKRLRSLLFN